MAAIYGWEAGRATSPPTIRDDIEGLFKNLFPHSAVIARLTFLLAELVGGTVLTGCLDACVGVGGFLVGILGLLAVGEGAWSGFVGLAGRKKNTFHII